MSAQHILVVDDDHYIAQALKIFLSERGFTVKLAHTGREGLQLFMVERPDLVLLDVGLPDMDGWEICRQIREISAVPIVFLTAAVGVENAIRGLELGAVGYVEKPMDLRLLAARIRATLRQVALAAQPEPQVYFADDYLEIDGAARQVRVEGRPVSLTKTEQRLLFFLFENHGRVVPYEEILQEIWGWEQDDVAKVHVYLSRLRRKVEPDPRVPRYLLTAHGQGYRLRLEAPPAPAD